MNKKRIKRIQRIQYLYLAVTDDELELPLIVSDTIKELSNKTNISTITIYSSIYKNSVKTRIGMRFRRIKKEV